MKGILPVRSVLAFAGLFAAALAAANAQESRATLSGTITDPSGSTIVGAKLNLTSIDTGIVASVESNQSGQYRFLFINPGRYRLAAEMAGFRAFIREGIE